MRPLSELVKFRNDLVDRFEQLSLTEKIGNIIEQLNLTITENFDVDGFSAHDNINQAIVDYQKILDQSEFIKNNLKSVIGEIEEKIIGLSAQPELTKKYINYLNDVDSTFTFIVDDSIHQLIKDRMSHYGDHRFPGLRLGCGYFGQLDSAAKNHELSIEYSNSMVANDPLYFVDQNQRSLELVTNHFNEVYQRRIRLYQDYTQLPPRQFSFIFSWGLFNYLELSTIENYLQVMFNLLRPGGTAMFSYNNCDIIESARIADMGEMSFVSKRNLTNLLKKIGFDVIASYDLPNTDTLITNISWLEIRRPGELITTKLRQVMGTVGRK